MFVVPSKRKLVFQTNDNDAVLSVMPHAKEFVWKNQKLIAVDHDYEEIKFLRNLGYDDVPSPIQYYYDWPGRFPAMPHQKDTAAFMTQHERALCLNAPGTGKTLSMLWAADYMLSEKDISRVLIVAPLSTVKTVWGKEIMHHFVHRNFNIVTGTRKRRAQLAADRTVEILIVNHDGFTTMPEAFKDCDLVIYDEATALKSHSSNRFKVFYKFMDAYRPRLWMLTGTPISQSPTDAWTLAKLTESPKVPRSFNQFKEMTMYKVSQFRWMPRDEALAICKAVMQPSIRFSLDECKALPQTNFIDRETELTTMQQKAFKEMQKEAAVMGTDITAANAAVLFQKLLQISCGVAYDQVGDHIKFDDTKRIEALEEIINEVSDKLIIFVPLRGVQDRLEALLSKKYDVASVHGGVSKNKRNEIFDSFQNSANIQILIAHPKVAAHGLTLTRSRSIVWYAPIYSLEQYEQANARIRRLSTEGKTVIYHLYATGFEKSLYHRLKNKQQVLSNFLELVRGTNDD